MPRPPLRTRRSPLPSVPALRRTGTERTTVQQRLTLAIEQQDRYTLVQLLDDPLSALQGLDVNRFDPVSDETPMIQLARLGWTEGMTLLLAHGADPRLQPEGALYPPLHRAALWGHAAMVDGLIDVGGVSVDQRTHDGWTALHLVADQGSTPMVQHLLDRGAGRDLLTSATGRGIAPSTALRLAQRNGHGAVVAIFEAPLLRAVLDDEGTATDPRPGRERSRL